MLGFLGIQPLISLFSFWWPLLLSVKALQAPGENVQFLLTYWLFYACISSFQFHVLALSIPLSSIMCLGADVLNLWMFYSHGCLLVTHYYIPNMTGRPLVHVIEGFDKNLLDPLIMNLWVRNKFLQGFLRSKSPKSPIIDDLMLFNQSLCDHFAQPKRLTILQFSLEYFCYMDLENELNARYLKSRGSYAALRAAILPREETSVIRGDSRVSSKTPKQRDLSLNIGNDEQFAWKSAPQTRHNSGKISRNISSKDLYATDPQSRTFSESKNGRIPEYINNKHFANSTRPVRVSSSPANSAEVRIGGVEGTPISGHYTSKSRNASGSEKIHVTKRTRNRADSITNADPPYPVR
ncbi:hypothetical protein METSCH_D04050 [Metschnikowia aff. pulcherrima]|uniref:HVA22-like protein n=1 Tax=Metschnikowia aff. pulcherrima TaxID=2163413 RepID=A0A4P6XRH3_9ASCO|nr:hypothetical protein METSCH_D04050 [Metschnikowia aff. pulcherrima]